MQSSRQYLRENNILPTISFKTQAVHTVKLLKDKLETLNTDNGTKNGVRFMVEEDGERKTFFTGSAGLIAKLAEFNPGDIVTIEMKSVKGQNGFISVFEVSAVGRTVSPESQNAPQAAQNPAEIDIPQVPDDLRQDEEISINDIPF